MSTCSPAGKRRFLVQYLQLSFCKVPLIVTDSGAELVSKKTELEFVVDLLRLSINLRKIETQDCTPPKAREGVVMFEKVGWLLVYWRWFFVSPPVPVFRGGAGRYG